MQGNDSYRLVVRRGPQPNQTYDLNKDIITLGRDITNDIVINDPEASRHHLRLARSESGFTIEDLGSTNGTFVNGQRLSGVRPLNNGDLIGLGETVTLGFELARSPGVGEPLPAEAPGPDPQQAPPMEQPPAAQPPGYQLPSQEPAAQPPQQPPAYSPPSSYDAPPQQAEPGGYYDYDPYAVRDEEPRSAVRWILIGCVGLSLVCCCTIVLGLVIIDQARLWCDIPVFKDIITPILFGIGQALGFVSGGGAAC